MAPVHRVDGRGADASSGRVRLAPRRAAWSALMIGGAAAAPFVATWPAVLVFVVLTYVTLLLGHSVGMHRYLIHRTFEASQRVAYPLVWLGTLVGMGGPSRIIETHDLRDWAQRQARCHDGYAHRRGFWTDLGWQLFCRIDLDAPPRLEIEPSVTADPFYRHLDRWWAGHQAVLAASLFAVGGWPFVLWGVCARVTVSVVGHWSVTYVCHNPGPSSWRVMGAGVQASDLRGPFLGFLTHGECWHSNHHAFPESARIGLAPGQVDPAFAVIAWLERRGLARQVGRPRAAGARDDLVPLAS